MACCAVYTKATANRPAEVSCLLMTAMVTIMMLMLDAINPKASTSHSTVNSISQLRQMVRMVFLS